MQGVDGWLRLDSDGGRRTYKSTRSRTNSTAIWRGRPKSADEATFRWHLIRTFGEMIEIGTEDVGSDRLERFRDIAAQLETYRRPDTDRLIELIRSSARSWMSGPGEGAWTPNAGGHAVGPDVNAEFDRLLPTWSSVYCARLDAADHALLENLAIHPA